MSAEADDRGKTWTWEPRIATGYDVYTQKYYLALDDTTETVGEMELTLDADGHTNGRQVHNWRFRPRLVFGTERYRQQLDWNYELKPDLKTSRLRLSGYMQARQYRGTTNYNLSSDNIETNTQMRWLQGYQGRAAGELKLQLVSLDYADPSQLEVDYRDARAGFYLRSGRAALRNWRAGVRLGQRSYPDSSVINRKTGGLEIEYDHNAFLKPNFRFSYRGERRLIEDDTVRPSSWGHWGLAEASVPVGEQQLVAEVQNEIWHYDSQWGAYNNQVRWTGASGLRGGGLDSPGWLLKLTLEDLDSSDAEECFRQMGVRGGLDYYGEALTGALTIEIGQRDYEEVATDTVYDAYYEPLYSDFTYMELWLILSWRLSAHLNLDAMINYLPESHSQDTDNQSMGFGNIRMLYRF